MSSPSCPVDGAPFVSREPPLGDARVCTQCGGAWLEWRLVERLLSAQAAASARRAAAAAPLGPRRCPVGCGRLAQWDLLGIAVDTCQSCGGLWLDKGEATRIVEESRRRGASNPEWQRDSVPDQIDGAFNVLEALHQLWIEICIR